MASEFLLAYRELVTLAGNDPTNLVERADRNPDLQAACDRVGIAYSDLLRSERYSGKQYAHTIPKYEIEARQGYESRWRKPVAETDPLFRGLSMPAPGPQSKRDPETDKIENAVELARWEAGNFESLIEYARERVNNDETGEFSDWAWDALRVWDDLRIRTGFDVGSVLARLELVPFTQIPSEVSDAHGENETISLFRRLDDAQRAFVFGCHLACAALQRSILEDVLPQGGKLHARIDEARLPWPLKANDLHDIRGIANDVLHADRKDRMEQLEKIELVRRLVRGMHTLKTLIESAPIGRNA